MDGRPISRTEAAFLKMSPKWCVGTSGILNDENMPFSRTISAASRKNSLLKRDIAAAWPHLILLLFLPSSSHPFRLSRFHVISILLAFFA